MSPQRRGPRLRRSVLAAGVGVGLASMLAACVDAPSNPTSSGAQTFRVGVTITSRLAAGDSFTFALDETGQSVTVTESGVPVKFPQPVAAGASYALTQTSGPRTCTVSPNRTGTVTADVVVTADCGETAGLSALKGTLTGPVGASPTLQNNGKDDLAVTVPPLVGGPGAYNTQSFAFANMLLGGSSYSVTLKAQPAQLACEVYAGATGTLTVGAETVKVGCERIHDLASRSSDDAVKATFFESAAPVLGGAETALGSTAKGYGEGRFVAFASSASGIDGSTGAHRQVFWRDRLDGTTRLVSKTAAGVEGDGDSVSPAISADGMTVSFESSATNLVPGDTNAVRDVFLTVMTASSGPERVSVGPAGAQANATSYDAAISADGKVVAFSSGASNLAPGVSGINTINVFLRDRTAATTILVSADPSGVGVGGSKPALSEDGGRLAFYSFASTLVSGDTNRLWDIFVYDRTTGARSRVSLTSSGGERNPGTESASREVAPAISGDGRFVAFATTASNVVAGDTNGAQDVFVVDTQTNAVVRASVGSGDAQGDADTPVGQGERVALSYDGSVVAFTSSATTFGATAGNVFLRGLKTGKTQVVSSGAIGGVGAPSLSRRGVYAAYGAATPLDGRFPSTGLFVTYTGLGKPFMWK